MKKLLSLFACTFVVSISTSFAISCKTLYKQYQEFEDLINQSKNKTMILYLGANDNKSAKSFEQGLEELTQTNSLNQAIKKINDTITTDATNFIYKFKNNLNWNSTTNHTTVLNNVNVKKDKNSKTKKERWIIDEKKSSNNNQIFKNMTNDVVIKNLKYDSDDKIWNKGLTSKILNEYLVKNWAKAFYGETSSSFSKNNNTVTEKVEKLQEKVKSLKGPLFLIIRDKMFYGIVSGFETFSKQDQKNATKTIDNFTNGSEIRKDVFDKWLNYLKQSIEMYDVVKLLQDSDPMITPKTDWKYQSLEKVEEKKQNKKSDKKEEKDKNSSSQPSTPTPAPAPSPSPAPAPATPSK
ncbi:lipoprotein [Mycoplasma leachii]|uniref:Putative lipoprotein n=1 Tax=Mycoplasma leachii 06049 TaxID=1188244 RepID=A0A2T4IA32_9MOLU|nr:lipoprotein [Mycoplasma leachii]PTD31431.1 putative lipoprotein [Mycoplasma leachii 06049]